MTTSNIVKIQNDIIEENDKYWHSTCLLALFSSFSKRFSDIYQTWSNIILKILRSHVSKSLNCDASRVDSGTILQF